MNHSPLILCKYIISLYIKEKDMVAYDIPWSYFRKIMQPKHQKLHLVSINSLSKKSVVHLMLSFLKSRKPIAVTHHVHCFSKLLGQRKQFCTCSVDIHIFMHIWVNHSLPCFASAFKNHCTKNEVFD